MTTDDYSPPDATGRIAITTLGVHDDVAPYFAFAHRLLERGHEVLVLAPEQYGELAENSRVPFAPLPGDILALNDPEEARKAVSGSKGVGAGMKLLDYMRPIQERYLVAEWEVLEAFGPDMIVYHPKAIGVPHAAERLGCRTVLASTLPGLTPTSAFASPLLPFRSLGPLNRWSHTIASRSAARLFKKSLRRFRAETLGLGERGRGRRPDLTLYAYSPHVLPPPGDWGRDVFVSGYWTDRPGGAAPPEALTRFLEEGPAPVLFDLAAVPGIDPARTTAIVLDALERTDKRGVLLTADGGLALDDPPANVFVVETASREALLPAMDAVVHQGGATSTGLVLAAGRPNCVFAQIGVQPFWGRGIKALGVGPEPLTVITFSSDRLVWTLKAMDDPDMRERARALGEQIAGEDGTLEAARFLEAFL